MDDPTDRIRPYIVLCHIKGANTYGVPREKWVKMTKKQKTAFRDKLWRENLKLDPVAHAAHRERQAELYYRYRERIRNWRAANRSRVNANKRAYAKRRKAHLAISQEPEKIFALITKAIPRGWPKPMRDDIAGMICVDILENRATLDHIDQLVKAAATRFNRTMETWKTKSLDAPIGSTDIAAITMVTADDLPWN
ncbi:MAG: hypothetical protein EOS12_28650 [Mesorhizobium sp.]|nr:MAG: hypothetical protein EOS12_28650 [Mesorhizobium sp.]